MTREEALSILTGLKVVSGMHSARECEEALSVAIAALAPSDDAVIEHATVRCPGPSCAEVEELRKRALTEQEIRELLRWAGMAAAYAAPEPLEVRSPNLVLINRLAALLPKETP